LNRKSLLFIALTLIFFAQAGKTQELPQEEQTVTEETVAAEEVVSPILADVIAAADSLAATGNGELEKIAFSPNPKRAVWLALVPGLGQIYNRKYWKLPIVYGGFMGCTYAITWNNRTYNDYKAAYLEFMTTPDIDNALWWNYVPPGVDPPAVKGRMESYLKNNKDNFRRYRDLSVIITAAVYLLSIVDAYVDAQLYDFDISPDLGVRVEPAVFDRTAGNAQAYGLQCNIKF
jgi:hypothetical protein